MQNKTALDYLFNLIYISGDEIIKEQRKRIEELQRELYKSQQQLQKIRQTQPTTVRAEKLVLQQHIQNKMQQQQLALHLQQLQHLQQQQQQQQESQTSQQNQQQTQQQHAAFQQLNAKASLAAFLQAQPNNSTAVLDSTALTAINNKKNQMKNNTTVQLPAAIVLNLAKATKLNGSLLGALVAQAQTQQSTSAAGDIKPPPPQYDEAAKLLKVNMEIIVHELMQTHEKTSSNEISVVNRSFLDFRKLIRSKENFFVETILSIPLNDLLENVLYIKTDSFILLHARKVAGKK